jgi:hypothetical protein
MAQARPFFSRAQPLDRENVYVIVGEAAACALAAALGPSGRDIAALLAEAEALATKAVAVAPDYLEQRERIIGGLRRAGAPEGESARYVT